MDISKYDESIQKAINNFEANIEKMKIQRIQKENNLKAKLQNVHRDLITLKKAIEK